MSSIGNSALRLCAIAIIIVGCCISFAREASAQSTVCSNQEIPVGDVVTKIVPAGGTCGPYYSEYFLSAPSDHLNICTISPIPAPYVIVDIATSAVCNGANQWQITHPLNNQLICSNSPLPAGFVVNGVEPGVTACMGAQGYTLQQVTTQSVVDACYFSQQPYLTGYVIDYAGLILNCGGAITYEWRLPTNNMTICPFSKIPTGWAIEQQVAVSNCDGQSPGYEIDKPTSPPTLTYSPAPVVIPAGQSSAPFTVYWNAPGYGQVSLYAWNGVNVVNGAPRGQTECLGNFGSSGSIGQTISKGFVGTITLTPYSNCTPGVARLPSTILLQLQITESN